MIKVNEFYKVLEESNIDFFTGVPDSLLKSFCAYVKENTPDTKNIIAANEGNALALAAGYYLATTKIPLVYMQNSGLGNIINPVTSLMDPLVYSIPTLLLIGWRGEPGKKDEPQHIKQGKITIELLDTLKIKYSILSSNSELKDAKTEIQNAVEYMKENNECYALVIKKDTFEGYKSKTQMQTKFQLKREDAIKFIMRNIEENAAVVSTTGMTSRELFELREHFRENHEKDFLTVGSMGHASQIALGIAIAKPNKNVYCLDGDGAFIMHMGGISIVGQSNCKNYKHIVINNGSHDSVGGQPTVGLKIKITSIAKACGYKTVLSAKTEEEIINKVKELKLADGPALLEIRVNKGARKDLGRPTTTPIENKEAFMEFLSKC
ncbi:phosphoenolpyruvate decarboxylase [Clostridium novyi A str. 4552]|uniref:Phosphoenolpyruvate decarboxylase n=1 Tax=Clostridium novyi A str. 4552 TaxID=1444289 RepID=A0A0A0HXI3_CLONO|nr:phosphonopyruvate decarboxylase [Clostridium novyi]KGM92766.1 phosphoenolpyruvate decarboxylase [Clostridium novyi A str. 4552]